MNAKNAAFVKSYTSASSLPEDLPQVACLGRSNVGKSSLINTLTGQKNLARTSSTPGRTQLINLFKIDNSFYLADLPGYGFAQLSKKERGRLEDLVYEYLNEAKNLRWALVIIDAFVGPTDLDEETVAFLESARIPHIIVANKIDQLSRTAQIQRYDEIKSRFPAVQVVPFSSVTGLGKQQLLTLIQGKSDTAPANMDIGSRMR